jgi:hypothetical protein
VVDIRIEEAGRVAAVKPEDRDLENYRNRLIPDNQGFVSPGSTNRRGRLSTLDLLIRLVHLTSSLG